MRRGPAAGLGALLLGSAAVATAAAANLEPYQMVRSLQLVQDELAGGDHAALPMQRKLLEMIDERLRTASKEELSDERNFRAVLIYGVSGGNPRTVEIVLSRLGVTSQDPIASGVLGYLQGRTDGVMKSLAAVHPMEQEFEFGAFLALVKGSVVAGQEPQAGLAFLDQARLLAPGTLIEESALRRSVALAAASGDAERFLRASSQYVRRFLRSPYATQFADAFVSGVITLNGAIDHATLAEMVAQMTHEHQEVIYLRLARRGAIEGLMELSAFAASKVTELERQTSSGDPRALLYSSIASVASATVDEVAEKLKAIDVRQLTAGDRKLLHAAEAIAAEVLADPLAAGSAAPQPAALSAPAADAAAAPSNPQAEPVQVIMEEARKRLEEVDNLLGKSGG